ncbi:hypothetical protein ACFQJD_00305 [Haloplanus sp. GCM10025708]|uniref:hypothetical protein n=1 Tax=Haloplanus sp. GCM10025708 TaxID=3252679 RepID=UPI003616EDB9
MDYFHDRLDDPMGLGEGRTAREYLREERGWSDETIDAAGLGWAPTGDTALLDHLMRQGFDREAILGTGLFYENGLRPHFRGRVVFPYFDVDGRPVYAIARTVDHPDDHLDAGQKYIKAIKTKDHSVVDEPIYGLGSLAEGDGPILITEGVADAITAHAAGYRCVSPVTTRFKQKHLAPLREALAEYDADVYVVQDAERPTSSLSEDGELHVEQHPPGLRGALQTAAWLTNHDVDAYVAELPRPGLDKVDLDDYLQGWGGLEAVLASSKPANEHPAFSESEIDDEGGEDGSDTEGSDDYNRRSNRSALFDLDITDVTGLDAGERGRARSAITGTARTISPSTRRGRKRKRPTTSTGRHTPPHFPVGRRTRQFAVGGESRWQPRQ